MTIQPVIVVLVDTQGRGICRSCHARLTWYETVGGRRMPFNGAPKVERVHRDQTIAGSPWIGEIPRELVHWATCPDADKFRRSRP